MNVLVLNSGSSSLKFQRFEGNTCVSRGMVDGIGLDTCQVILNGRAEPMPVKDHVEAIAWVFSQMQDTALDAIGHRVVHGGELYREAVLIDATVIRHIEKLCALAPLHNPANLEGIKACRKIFPKVPQVAVFDTAFHQTMPQHAYRYAIPEKFYSEHQVRKYGFHGTSHQYLVQETCRQLRKKTVNIITCHLGNGASVAAIHRNLSIDTSMGFTPLQGLVMGSRSGDIDPAIVGYLAAAEDKGASDIINILNKQSGLLGLCGYSDMRTVHEQAEHGDKACQLALDVFSYRLVQYIGMYAAMLDKVDALVFAGGIGEGAYYVRENVCKRLAHLGFQLDIKKNRANNYAENPVMSSPDSPVKILVLKTNEELMIVQETQRVLGQITVTS